MSFSALAAPPLGLTLRLFLDLKSSLNLRVRHVRFLRSRFLRVPTHLDCVVQTPLELILTSTGLVEEEMSLLLLTLRRHRSKFNASHPWT